MDSFFSRGCISPVASFGGINIFYIKSKKFKTNSINVFYHDSLNAQTAAKNALLPAVLKRGCVDYPTIRDISMRLEQLYGAIFDCGVTKKGESQVIQFFAEFISDKYTDTNLTKKITDLILQIINKPIVQDYAFKNEYVEQEIKNLKDMIESRVNDKVQYAVDKCFEEMCVDEPFGIFDYGSIEELEKINAHDLYKHYLYFTRTLPMYVFVFGDIAKDDLRYIIDAFSKLDRESIKRVKKTDTKADVSKVRNVTEKMDVGQGKLSLGFRTNVPPSSKDYYKLMLYNSILGGGLHSKLFQNVREKEGLAYYVFSRLERFKGLMVISSGIEVKNKDKALKIIEKQLDDIKNGDISDYEYEASIKSIETGIESLKDSPLRIVDFFLSQHISGADESLNDMVENIKGIKKADIAEIAEKIKLDLVYFLEGLE